MPGVGVRAVPIEIDLERLGAIWDVYRAGSRELGRRSSLDAERLDDLLLPGFGDPYFVRGAHPADVVRAAAALYPHDAALRRGIGDDERSLSAIGREDQALAAVRRRRALVVAAP